MNSKFNQSLIQHSSHLQNAYILFYNDIGCSDNVPEKQNWNYFNWILNLYGQKLKRK